MSMVGSFDRLRAERPVVLPHRRIKVRARDGVQLMIGVFEPSTQPVTEVLVLFHGAGAHMGAGYLDLAKELHRMTAQAVLVPDLRGHGLSGGARGTASDRQDVWDDVNAILALALERYPGAKLYLVGHSLGASLCVNLLTTNRANLAACVTAVVLIAPYTGVNGAFTPYGHDFIQFQPTAMVTDQTQSENEAGDQFVRFDYPEDIVYASRLVSGYDREMFHAMAPDDAMSQFKSLDMPVFILCARDDELLCPKAMGNFISSVENDQIYFEVVVGGHLECLYLVHDKIVETLGLSHVTELG
jgi:alpha-beta hydrolase superfamily lysophospholipase